MAATAALAISPGPDNIYVLVQSISHGRKYGLATVAGLISGCLVHTTFLAVGISAILRQNQRLYFGIKLFGVAYLVYLAYQVFKGDDSLTISENGAPKKEILQLFRQGFIMNVLNPKVSIFFLAFFPGFLFSSKLSTFVQFYVLGLIFMFVSSVVFSILVVSSVYISGYLRKHAKTGFYLKWMQIIVFISIATYLLLSNK